MKKIYTFVTLKGENDNLIATVPAIPGIIAEASSMEELFPRIKEAISVYNKTLQKEKLDTPSSYELLGVNQVEVSNE